MNLNHTQLAALANSPVIREALAAANAEALQARQALVDSLDAVTEEARPEIVGHLATADAAMKRVGELKEEIKAQQQIEGVARPAATRLQLQLDRKTAAIRDDLARTADPRLARFHLWASEAHSLLRFAGYRAHIVGFEGQASANISRQEAQRITNSRAASDAAFELMTWAEAQRYSATPAAELTEYMRRASAEIVALAEEVGASVPAFKAE